MNRYPDLPVAWESRLQREDGRELTVTAGGVLRGRDLWAGAPLVTLELVHPYIEAADAGTLEAFYAANRSAEFLYAWPLDHSGQPHDYRVLFDGPPEIVKVGPQHFTARVRLKGRRT